VSDDSEPLRTLDVGATRAGGERVPLKLVVVAGPDEGREMPLDRAITIGSDPECELCLTDRAVSRKHCEVALDRGRAVLRDLGSRNGTSVAGTKVKEAELAIGSVVTLGQSALVVQPRWYVREVPPSQRGRFGEVLGESLAMREIFAVLERVAPTEATVLVEGESGCGKELVARSIHAASARVRGPYVVFDCGAVPAELAESELFGHKKGAFSGAVADRPGTFAQADGGTLCLDEIGELPLDLQPKLLRALETGEVKPVGADTMRKVDVRVIAATNRDLHAEARRGRFREDLYYRLDVVKVRIAPLRQRPDDIPVLAKKLLEGKVDGEIGGANLQKLLGYAWPGNVRELRNTLARAVALAGKPGGALPKFADLVFNLGPSAPSTIGSEYPGVASPVPYKDAKAQVLRSFHRAFVTALLERHGGNIKAAAQAADMSRKHLHELIDRLESDTLPDE
jgi:transcriptional regulator with GAF, ATPase, and Fis domain